MKRYNDFFGSYGGRFVAEMLRAPLDDLQEAFLAGGGRPGVHAASWRRRCGISPAGPRPS